MICLCCGKPIKNEEAASCGWHHSCIKHFFGTTRLPEITISNEALEWIANETISKGYTVPGVQKKLSLHLSKEEKARLTLVGYPSGYILKPQTNEYRALPEAEQMIMCMADAAGITTVPHGLIQSDGTYAYITKRVDRMVLPDQSIRLLAMEDFCQLTYRFFALAAACHLSSAAAEKMIKNLIKKVDVLISIAEHAAIPDDIRQGCIALLIERAAVFA